MARPNWQTFRVAAALIAAAVCTTPAAAQSPAHPRVEIAANAGALTGANKFTESDAIPSNGGETETITVDHGVKTAPGFSVGGAMRIASRVWVGAQYAATQMKPGASITAVIPHPILFNAPRTVQGSIDNVAHNEQNVHVDLMYAIPAGALDVKVMGGPTFFNLKQDFVSGVTITEAYPFDTATFAGATTKRLSNSGVGFNAGVDLSYPLASPIGIGGLIRYSSADVKFDDPNTGHHTVKAGGLEAGAGVRIKF
jgi:hypothetical protein